MRRVFQAVTIVATAFFMLLTAGGCGEGRDDDPLFSAVGSYGDVAVITSDPSLFDLAGPFMDRLSPDHVFVIKTEETYRFHHYTGKEWRNGRNYRNLLFLLRWGDGGPVEKEIRSLVSEASLTRLTGGAGGVLTIRDPYFRNQLATVVVAPERRTIPRLLDRNAPALADTLAADIDRRMVRDNRRNGVHTATIRRDWGRHGFWLEIPKSYRENQYEPDGYKAVEYLSTLPDGAALGLTTAWADDIDSGLADRDALLALRRDVGRVMQDDSELNDASLEWSDTTLAGHPAVKLTGAWASVSAGVGGPFWCYFVKMPDRDRIVMVDLLVYAPNREKMDDMRRLAAIAGTLSFDEPRP